MADPCERWQHAALHLQRDASNSLQESIYITWAASGIERPRAVFARVLLGNSQDGPGLLKPKGQAKRLSSKSHECGFRAPEQDHCNTHQQGLHMTAMVQLLGDRRPLWTHKHQELLKNPPAFSYLSLSSLDSIHNHMRMSA